MTARADRALRPGPPAFVYAAVQVVLLRLNAVGFALVVVQLPRKPKVTEPDAAIVAL